MTKEYLTLKSEWNLIFSGKKKKKKLKTTASMSQRELSHLRLSKYSPPVIFSPNKFGLFILLHAKENQTGEEK